MPRTVRTHRPGQADWSISKESTVPQGTCKEEDCNRRVNRRGWCQTHYKRWRQTGSPGGPITRQEPQVGRTCSAPACEEAAWSRGWCKIHGERVARRGHPDLPPPRVCSLADCERPHRARDYCLTHYQNLLQWGHPRGRQPTEFELCGGLDEHGVVWRPVKGQEGRYLVSELGAVWSVPKERTPGGMLALTPSWGGYRTAYVGGATLRVHVVVATAFHGDRSTPHSEVRHLNGVPHDNRAENLAWGSSSENALDKLRHGTMWQAHRRWCPRGHLLEGENLVRCKLPNRSCRACSNTSSLESARPGLDFLGVADAYYRQYTGREPEPLAERPLPRRRRLASGSSAAA